MSQKPKSNKIRYKHVPVSQLLRIVSFDKLNAHILLAHLSQRLIGELIV